MQDIIVGVDRSETARRAATSAAELAAKCDANLHLVTCVERHGRVNMDVGTDHFRSDPISEARTLIEEALLLSPESEVLAGKRVESYVSQGDYYRSRNTSRAREAYAKALELDPDNAAGDTGLPIPPVRRSGRPSPFAFPACRCEHQSPGTDRGRLGS